MLSKGQPLETWCLLLEGSATLTSYSTKQPPASTGGLLAQPTVPPAPATPAPLTRPASGRLGSVGGGAGAAGAEVVTTVALQAPEGSWGEVALLHSSQPQRSTRTVVAGPTVRVRVGGGVEVISRTATEPGGVRNVSVASCLCGVSSASLRVR